MIDPERGKVEINLGEGIGPVTLWYPMRGRRELRMWLEKNRPDELFGRPTEVSLAAYYWSGQLWAAPRLEYKDVQTQLDQVEQVPTSELIVAAQRALAYATAGIVTNDDGEEAATGKKESQ